VRIDAFHAFPREKLAVSQPDATVAIAATLGTTTARNTNLASSGIFALVVLDAFAAQPGSGIAEE
jgi:hypothetical protein